jgi:DNA-3-methyladenine glycosylase II
VPLLPPPFLNTHRSLARRDPRLAALIKQVGPCTLQPNPAAFHVLTGSIISQQISIKAAASIGRKVRKLCGRRGVRPGRLEEFSDEELRACGLSAGKVLSMRSLSRYFLENRGLIRRLKDMPDDEVIEALIPIRGIGVWTAQMFLMFSLGRPDVLPVADLGLRAGVRDVLGHPELPTAETLTALGEPWRPFRSVATWYFWRSRGGPITK